MVASIREKEVLTWRTWQQCEPLPNDEEG